ncbi:MAG: hypothetical protein ACREVG_17700 [Burkholderiales bacterium]
MLKWLGGKPDHPMHSVKAAEKILSELAPADSEQALEEVCGYLESVSKAPDFKPDVRSGVVQALDDYGRKYQDSLIEEYLGAARIHDLKSRERCQKAYEFWAALSAAYTECLDKDFPIENGKRTANEDLIAQLVCRGVRAAAAQERVRHLAYQAVDKEVWTRLCSLYEIAEKAGVEARRVRVYKSDLNTMTPAQEVLQPLMLEMGAPESLAPEHVELAARTVASVATSFAIGRTPSASLPFCVDLAKPGRPTQVGENPPPPDARLRCFGPGTAIAKLDELLRADDTGRATNERRQGSEFTAWDRITVLTHLKRYWGPNRPSRRTGRTRAQGELSVLHSLDAIRTVAAQIGTDQMDAISETAKEHKQELRLVPENVDLTPETWAEKDSSESGVGAEVPSQRGRWVKVGRLCAVKGADFRTWWVGVIRRLDAASGARVMAGIQVLTKTPYSMWLKKVGMEGELASNWATSSGSMRYDYVDAVLLVPESEAMARDPLLVMRPQDFKPNLVCEALIGDKPRLIKFGTTIETGDDFAIVSCKWM